MLAFAAFYTKLSYWQISTAYCVIVVSSCFWKTQQSHLYMNGDQIDMVKEVQENRYYFWPCLFPGWSLAWTGQPQLWLCQSHDLLMCTLYFFKWYHHWPVTRVRFEGNSTDSSEGLVWEEWVEMAPTLQWCLGPTDMHFWEHLPIPVCSVRAADNWL